MQEIKCKERQPTHAQARTARLNRTTFIKDFENEFPRVARENARYPSNRLRLTSAPQDLIRPPLLSVIVMAYSAVMIGDCIKFAGFACVL